LRLHGVLSQKKSLLSIRFNFSVLSTQPSTYEKQKEGVNAESRERITTHFVVRAVIDNFLDRVGDMYLSNIDNEELLKERMEKVFKQKYSKRAESLSKRPNKNLGPGSNLFTFNLANLAARIFD
jgi:hypothetical protein